MVLYSGIVYGEPVAQGRPRFKRYGKGVSTYDPPKSKEYKNKIRKEINSREPLIEVPFKFVLTVYKPIPKSTPKYKREQMILGELLPTKKPDCDNYAKGVMDALNGHIWIDDSLIVDLEVKKRYSDNPRIEFECIDIAR